MWRKRPILARVKSRGIRGAALSLRFRSSRTGSTLRSGSRSALPAACRAIHAALKYGTEIPIQSLCCAIHAAPKYGAEIPVALKYRAEIPIQSLFMTTMSNSNEPAKHRVGAPILNNL
jgi:hypothetical protein